MESFRPVHKGFDDKGEGWFISVKTILYGRRAKAAYRKELMRKLNKGKYSLNCFKFQETV